MKKIIKLLLLALVLFLTVSLTGCFDFDESDRRTDTKKDIDKTFAIGDELATNQPTPTDVDYSLERYNLIKRAYWVNGQREKAMSLTCGITKPLGYIILITDNGSVLGRFTVDGKVSGLNSWLAPDYSYRQFYSGGSYYQQEMPDVDGTYGTNDDGIFFFTVDGKYIEWTGAYLYSDIPFVIDNPVLKIEGEN